jgi:hypothetical protein
VFEVADQLGEDPRLVRVGHRAVNPLDDRFGVDLAPRHVQQRHLAELLLVHGGWVFTGRGDEFVGNREHDVELVLARDIQIRFELGRL